MNRCYSLTQLKSAFRVRDVCAFGAIAVLLASCLSVRAVDSLAYSFETGLQGFGPNGGGTTITQDTIGATDGPHSMKVSVVGGATFVGALTGSLDPAIFGDPPGLDHVHFDMTITQRFDIPNPSPPPDRLGFARIGVIIFGVTQPDFPGGQVAVQAQIANLAEDEVPVGGLEPGTYKDRRIDLDKLTDPLTFETKTFNQIFGTVGSGPDDIIPTGFELYFNKTGGTDFPLTVYIDNIRFGTSVPGDYNGNDVVDAADYVLWRKTTNPEPANFRNEVASPGTIDAADYAAWRARFGNNSALGSGLVSSSVPEPASGWLLLIAISAAFRSCSRRITPYS
jgi:hypothetical protein